MSASGTRHCSPILSASASTLSMETFLRANANKHVDVTGGGASDVRSIDDGDALSGEDDDLGDEVVLREPSLRRQSVDRRNLRMSTTVRSSGITASSSSNEA